MYNTNYGIHSYLNIVSNWQQGRWLSNSCFSLTNFYNRYAVSCLLCKFTYSSFIFIAFFQLIYHFYCLIYPRVRVKRAGDCHVCLAYYMESDSLNVSGYLLVLMTSVNLYAQLSLPPFASFVWFFHACVF